MNKAKSEKQTTPVGVGLSDLLNCPFCNNAFSGIARTKQYIYRGCPCCGARGPESDSIEEADERWNIRAI